MRVLMITPGYYPIKGGAETMVHDLSSELNNNGVNVDVMSFNMDQKWHPHWRGRIERIDGITVYKVPAFNWLPRVNSSRVKLGINLIPTGFKHLIKEYDILHFHEAEFSFPLFSYFSPKVKILHLHAFAFNYFKRYHLSRFILKHISDFYLSITRQMKNELIMIGVPKNKIIHFPNSVDAKIFKPGEKKTDDMILYVGRILPAKGLHILLTSLKYVERSIHLVVIGPRDWSYEYHHDILRRIEEENQKGKHRITFLGRVNQAKLIEYYQKASVFVLPSLFEPFGIVILESLSCETPVVSTYAGGIPEIVKNGENGILIPANNPQRLAEAINALLENNGLREKYGKAGREMVVKNFSLESSANKLQKIYERMLKI